MADYSVQERISKAVAAAITLVIRTDRSWRAGQAAVANRRCTCLWNKQRLIAFSDRSGLFHIAPDGVR